METIFSYDKLPYPDLTFPQTHPDRLSTLGAFFGISTAEPDKCRVLELGCGSGANINSIAYALPESEFVGIDLSQVHISRARDTAREIGISNVHFVQADLSALDASALGKFDFIIAHGLYSWVPDRVRESILALYDHCLTPDGVGYISYNSYPGCHFRQIAGEMMRYHTASETDPYRKIEQGIAILNFAAENAEAESPYQTMLMGELEAIRERAPENIFHDDFSDFNQPFYFYEFVEQIGRNGLQYLAEADIATMSAGSLPPETQKMLEMLGGDIVRREQYLDFIRGRRFRSTLVCRKEANIERKPDPAKVNDFFISSRVTCNDGRHISDNAAVSFATPKGSTIEINHPLTKTALVQLGSIWPRSIRFTELINASCAALGESNVDPDDITRTASFLNELFKVGFVKFGRWQPKFAVKAGERPIASAFARWQISQGSRTVTTLAGIDIEMENEMVRDFVLLLDGSRTASDLLNELTNRNQGHGPDTDPSEPDLAQQIKLNLSRLAESGLLIA